MSIGIHEKEAVIELFSFLPDKPVVFDVGSNKGQWSDIILAEYKDDCTIYLFEPNELLLNYTRVKYDYNKNIIFSKNAMSAVHGKKVPFFYFNNENSGLSSLYHNPKWDYLPMIHGGAYTNTIDNYCKENKIESVDFLKIDVEGAEYDVLTGAQEMIQAGLVKFIQVEYSEHYKLSGKTFADVIRMVEAFGYYVYSFDGEFHKQSVELFTDDYRLENFIITKEPIANAQDWNKEFIENTKGLPKIELALEVGSFEGRTSRYICKNMLTAEGRIVCVDPLEDYYVTPGDIDYFKGQHQRFLRNTRNLPVNLIRKKSNDAWEELKDLRFQFIYIDGDHSEQAVYDDCTNGFKILKKGGHMLIDDYTWSEGTTRGIDKFLSEHAPFFQLVTKNYQVLIKKL
jgi:FkbM family methyltransferase